MKLHPQSWRTQVRCRKPVYTPRQEEAGDSMECGGRRDVFPFVDRHVRSDRAVSPLSCEALMRGLGGDIMRRDVSPVYWISTGAYPGLLSTILSYRTKLTVNELQISPQFSCLKRL